MSERFVAEYPAVEKYVKYFRRVAPARFSPLGGFDVSTNKL